MTDSRRPITPPTEDAIRQMLESRASRVRTSSIDLATVVAAAGPRVSVRFGRAVRLAPRLSLIASTVAAILVTAALVAIPLFNRPTGSGTPSGIAQASVAVGSSSDAGPSSPPTSSVRLLTPAEVGELARTQSRELSTKIIAVRGRLEADPSVRCRTAVCTTVLANSGGGFVVRPVGDIGPGPWDGSGPKDGTFVLRITPNLEGGRGPVFEYLAELTPPTDGRLAWSVTDILGGSAPKEGAYAAVDGWLVRDALHPCASTSRPSGVAYGCPTDDWLTASEYQPTQPNGPMIGPRSALLLSSGSYDRWAPDPAQLGGGVEPRRATYLMWLVMDGCGPTADCYQGPANLHWRIVDRFDPIPNIAPTPSASLPSAS